MNVACTGFMARAVLNENVSSTLPSVSFTSFNCGGSAGAFLLSPSAFLSCLASWHFPLQFILGLALFSHSVAAM